MWRSRARVLFRNLFRKPRMEAELDAELRAYQDLLVERYLEEGMTPAQAARRARMELGGAEQIKEQVRDVRVGAGLDSVLQDFRYAARSLAKTPGFAAIVVLTLALGIGINTAVFSVVYATLLQPLPYTQPERLVLVWSTFSKSAASRAPTSGPLVEEIRRRTRTLQDVGGIWVGNGTFTGDHPEQVKVAQVTTNFLSMLGVRPALGRVFTPDEQSGGRTVVILSYGLWQRRFAGDPKILGTGVAFQGGAATVVGVMPKGFRLYFAPDANVPADVQAFSPFEGSLAGRPLTLYYIRVVARLKPGVHMEQAQQDMDAVAAQLRGAYTEIGAENLQMSVTPMQADAVRDIRPSLIVLFAGAVFVMLICCVNLANLVLARANTRSKEIALRIALGAGQRRIARQLLTEGLLLCSMAGAAGLLLGWIGIRWLLQTYTGSLSAMGNIGVNWAVLAFAGGLAMAAVLLCGLAPGLEPGTRDLWMTLRETNRATQSTAAQRVRRLLIVCEMTVGFVLLIGAGLMIRTFVNLERLRPGFEPRRLLTFQIEIPGQRFSNVPAVFQFVRNWEEQLAALPGVRSAGAISHLPLDDYPNWYSAVRPEGVAAGAGVILADHRCVTPGYLQTMGVRLLEGRYFSGEDRAGNRLVAIVDENLARSSWPGQSAIGKRIEAEHLTGNGFEPLWSEVVGVVEHVRNHSLAREVRGEIYLPFEQSPRTHLAYVVRTSGEPLALAQPVRQILRKLDQDLAISKVGPMTAIVDRARAPAGITAVLAGIFAGAALLLAAAGIYGVAYYSASQRTREMGVRMALGASSGDVLRLVMGEGMALAAIGMILGIGGALLVSRHLQELVFGVSTNDPLTYGVAMAAIPAAAIAGCWYPAWRAARANPLDAIRVE